MCLQYENRHRTYNIIMSLYNMYDVQCAYEPRAYCNIILSHLHCDTIFPFHFWAYDIVANYNSNEQLTQQALCYYIGSSVGRTKKRIESNISNIFIMTVVVHILYTKYYEQFFTQTRVSCIPLSKL